MLRLLIIMTIANTIMFIIAGSPYHAFGALVGCGYILLQKENQDEQE